MPKKRRSPTPEEWTQAGRTLRSLLRCRVIHPARWGVFCKRTPHGPNYLAKISKKYPGLSDQIPKIKQEGRYRACFITVLQDSCLPERAELSDWLRERKWPKRES